MAKAKRMYGCTECGATFPKWAGQCGECGAWNTLTETMIESGGAADETQRFDWIVNCTGPGAGRESGFPPSIAGLIENGYLKTDPDNIGVHSTPIGEAIGDTRVFEDLFVVGSLRKPDSWESTAVPELRVQAALAAEAILELSRRSP